MLTSLFWSLGGLVGAGAGLWIAALFLPQVALLLKATLDFLRSPLGTILGVGALGLFLFCSGWISGDIHGTRGTRAAWSADVAAKARAAASREMALQLEMKKTADAGGVTDESFSKSIDQQVQKNETEKSADAACRRATGADIGRLLSIH